MNPLTRAGFESLWERLNSEALAAKDSNRAWRELTTFYEPLDGGDREVVDQVLAEWLLGDDTMRRDDAEFLIRRFETRSALPALRLAMKPIASAVGPSMAFVRRKQLEEIIERLEQAPKPDS
jgi:hypothetical protein